MISFALRHTISPLLGLISGMWLLLIFFILNTITGTRSLDALQNTSSNFFVQCDLGECSSIILPFLNYVFNPFNLSRYFLGLWAIVTLVLGIYFFYEVLKGHNQWRQKLILLSATFFIALISILGSFQAEVLPCVLAALIASLTGKRNYPNWEFFVIASILFDLTLGISIFLSQTSIYLLTLNSKSVRLHILKILKSIVIGCLIIASYLAMIDYNFMQIDTSLKSELSTKNIWEIYIKIIAIYLSTLSASLFINAE